MAALPLANILHHKLRSALSALGIGIGVCMLVTLAGLSRGSLGEIADRWESVDADLIVFPRGWGENASDKSGSALPDRYAERILQTHGDIVRRVVPVFTWQIKLAGQDQIGRRRRQRPVGRTSPAAERCWRGALFDPDERFTRWLREKLLTAGHATATSLLELTEKDLSDPNHDGLELVIDSRLAKAGGYRLGQTVETANHRWRIVGIAPAGRDGAGVPAASRRPVPVRQRGRHPQHADVRQARPGADVGPAARALAATTGQDVVPLTRYRGMLMEKFGIMFVYVDAVNAIALVIAFLFIMVTLYTMVLQRTREIAILKSCGASDAFLLRQVLAESLLLTGAGLAAGVAMSFLAAWAHPDAPAAADGDDHLAMDRHRRGRRRGRGHRGRGLPRLAGHARGRGRGADAGVDRPCP